MITVSAAAQAVLTRSYQLAVRVESWLGSTLLAADVPIISAVEETDRSLRIPERLTLSVPRRRLGVDWSPLRGSPLAANGQRLHVQLGIGLAGAATEYFERGWFIVDSSTVQGGTVQVQCVGLLKFLDEARLVSPFQPTGNLTNVVRGLIEPALTVTFSGMTDRAVPAGLAYTEDRLGNLFQVLDAWPADGAVQPNGTMLINPVVAPTVALLAWTDGAGGTVVDAVGSSSRDGGYSVVVARGTAPDGGQVQGVAYDRSTGPTAYGGPFNPLPVPFFYESPLITTLGQAQSAADTRLATLQRSGGERYSVDHVPYPVLQTGDPIALTSARLGLTQRLCAVETLTLPYVPGGQPASAIVRAL